MNIIPAIDLHDGKCVRLYQGDFNKVTLYSDQPLEVAEILRRAVDECPHAHSDPEPIILFNEFGDNALNFEVHFWIQVRTMMQARRVESELRHTIDRLMRDAQITIAFPQRDVHLDSLRPIEVNVRQMTAGGQLSLRRSDAA